jgi:hypothetical protein
MATSIQLDWHALPSLEGVERRWAALRSHGRALTANLICRVNDAEDAERVAAFLAQIGPRHPSRIFLVSPGREGAAMQARVAAQSPGSEFVQIGIAPNRARSLVQPLLAADLPVVLLWRSDSSGGGSKESELAQWSAIADQVLLDAYRMGLSAEELAQLQTKLGDHVAVRDLTWTRLTPWRQLICQGLETMPDAWGNIAQVSITSGHRRQGERPGLATTLLAGWLGHQLQWVSEGSQVHSPSGKKIGLRFGTCPAEEKHGLFRRLVVECDGPKQGLSVVIQHRGERLTLDVHSGTRKLGEWSSAAIGELRSQVDTLDEELSVGGGDPLYQAALKRGVALLSGLGGAAR